MSETWNPEKLTARHRQVVHMKFAGFQTHVIADATGFTRAHVRRIVTSPEAQRYMSELQKLAIENGAALAERIRQTAEEAGSELTEALQ